MVHSLPTHRLAGADPAKGTPEGAIVVQRYRALEGAIVLVYTADADTIRPRCATACLSYPGSSSSTWHVDRTNL
ncbi:hypothetical protein [Streptomyces sp. NPDC050564]|uniref:hypothetical protein n=1 Tax=Streptomyces sp. NPDC050564 TaxID=3365631 RepID=UPI0037A1E6FF